MNLLYYLGEANIYLGVFYLAYCLLLTKETYYTFNRIYLLFSCIAAFILPVLQIGTLRPVEAAIDTTVNYTIPAYTQPLPIITHAPAAPVTVAHHLTLQDYLIYAYLTGACILFFMLIVKLWGLFRLMRKAQTSMQPQYKLVYLPQSNTAFSFFNYLFIGDNAQGAATIIRHELVHIRQKHSADIIFLEILKVINWFNPFIYLLQNSLKTVHEYIADEQTAALETDAITYSSFLVNNAYGAGGSSITHSFFNYNLLKKRIIMLNQQRSGNLARLKYLIAAPVFAGLLCTSTLGFSKTYGWIDLNPAKLTEVMNKAKVVETAAANTPLYAQYPNTAKAKATPTKPKTDHVVFTTLNIIANGYSGLAYYLTKTGRHYSSVKKTSAVVEVAFNVTADKKTTDARVSKILGDELFGDVALKIFNGYTGTVNDKPGLHSFLINFFYKKNTPEQSAMINSAGKTNSGCITIWQTDKFPPPIVRPDTTMSLNQDAFLKDLAGSVKYPAIDKNKHIEGKAIAEFSVDAEHNIQYIKVTKAPSSSLGNEIIRVLKKNKSLNAFTPGQQYTLPIAFMLNDMQHTLPETASADMDLSKIVYNPKGINIPTNNTGLILREVVIVGYTKNN